jgi:hypothetical protein
MTVATDVIVTSAGLAGLVQRSETLNHIRRPDQAYMCGRQDGG